MNRVIVVGSPRVNGRSAALADELLYACIDEYPEDGVSIVSVASTDVRPCTGCDACAEELAERPEGPEEGDPLYPHPLVEASDASLHRCVIEDDMAEVRKHLDAADELIVVSPVYFAGAPAQFKCLLDRLQPYYRSDLRGRVKRPMILHVVGEGGDPYGYDPLVGTVMSAFSVAGFQLQAIFDWVGKISEEGEILGEPEEYALADAASVDSEDADGTAPGSPQAHEARTSGDSHAEKLKLSLSQPGKGGKRPAREPGEHAPGSRRKGASSDRRKGASGNRRESASGKRAKQSGRSGSSKSGSRSGSKGGSSKGGRRG